MIVRECKEKVLICRPWITKNGKKIFASQYGKKAFCFWVDKQDKD